MTHPGVVLVARSLRASPSIKWSEAAARGSWSLPDTVNALRSLNQRGRCDQLVAAVLADPNAPDAARLMARRSAPPPLARLETATDCRDTVALAGLAGTTRWAHRCSVIISGWGTWGLPESFHKTAEEISVKAPRRALTAGTGMVMSMPAGAPPAMATRAAEMPPSGSRHPSLDIAQHSDCPRAVIGWMLTAHDGDSRRAAAASPSLGKQALKQLRSAEAPDMAIWAGIAANQNCPPQMLRELARVIDSKVRHNAHTNPSCPPDVLAAAMADPSDMTALKAAAANPNCFPAVLERLAAKGSDAVRLAVASSPHCPPNSLRRLAGDSRADTRQAVATNPSCPPNTAAELCEDFDESVREAAADHNLVPEDSIRRLAQTSDGYVRAMIAQHPACPPDVLTVLASDTYDLAALMAMSHPSCPPEAISDAGGAYDDYNIVEYVATNPACPPEALQRLATHTEDDVRAATARNASCPAGVLRRLSSDSCWYVRAAVARHLSCPTKTLRRLTSDSDISVAELAAANPQLAAAAI